MEQQKNESSSVPLGLYNDLMAVAKEAIRIRNILITKPSEQDIRDYKLLIKVFEAYVRIKENPEMTVSALTQKDTENNGGNKNNNTVYLFDYNTNTVTTTSKSISPEQQDNDSDIEPEDLFKDENHEVLSDDESVTLMVKKSCLQLDRALSNRNYNLTTDKQYMIEILEDPNNQDSNQNNQSNKQEQMEDETNLDIDDDLDSNLTISDDEYDIYEKYDNEIYGGYRNISKRDYLGIRRESDAYDSGDECSYLK